MTLSPQNMQASSIASPFNYQPSFSSPRTSSDESKLAPNFIEIIIDPNGQLLEQWAIVENILTEDTWYRNQGLSNAEEAKINAVLLRFREVCEVLVDHAKKRIKGRFSEHFFPDVATTQEALRKKELILTFKESIKIESTLAYLRCIKTQFNMACSALNIEPERQKYGFWFWTSLILILIPLITPIITQLAITLAIPASIAAACGTCFINGSALVQLGKFLFTYKGNNRRIYILKHKDILEQFDKQLREYVMEHSIGRLCRTIELMYNANERAEQRAKEDQEFKEFLGDSIRKMLDKLEISHSANAPRQDNLPQITSANQSPDENKNNQKDKQQVDTNAGSTA